MPGKFFSAVSNDSMDPPTSPRRNRSIPSLTKMRGLVSAAVDEPAIDRVFAGLGLWVSDFEYTRDATAADGDGANATHGSQTHATRTIRGTTISRNIRVSTGRPVFLHVLEIMSTCCRQKKPGGTGPQPTRVTTAHGKGERWNAGVWVPHPLPFF